MAASFGLMAIPSLATAGADVRLVGFGRRSDRPQAARARAGETLQLILEPDRQ